MFSCRVYLWKQLDENHISVVDLLYFQLLDKHGYLDGHRLFFFDTRVVLLYPDSVHFKWMRAHNIDILHFKYGYSIIPIFNTIGILIHDSKLICNVYQSKYSKQLLRRSRRVHHSPSWCSGSSQEVKCSQEETLLQELMDQRVIPTHRCPAGCSVLRAEEDEKGKSNLSRSLAECQEPLTFGHCQLKKNTRAPPDPF